MQNTLSFAQQLDQQDTLKHFRDKFYCPQHTGRNVIYFTGNSLGLQPKSARQAIEEEMQKWEDLGVEGHFAVKNAWFDYHKLLKEDLAMLTGTSPTEVTAMNSLTVNLQLLLMSFYRPEGKRTKILIEAGAFPSDQYAVESQALLHGLNPDETIIELKPGKGEHTLHTEDIIAKINELGDELALIMLGGVNYYTGQLFAIQAITKAGKAVGAVVGYDLAHAIGNVPLQLHDWNVDFACWCTYKYLNSSPGGVGGIFVHQNHLDNPTPRLTGWWGYEEKTRFQMKKGFVPERSADAWQMSNVPILLLATHRASLELFREAGGMKPLREKSLQLTGFLEFVIQDISRALNFKIDIITPQNPAERGCQLSLIVAENGKTLHEKLTEAGIIADWREPSVIRVAPVPLYNSFEDAYNFGQILKESIMRLKMVSHWL